MERIPNPIAPAMYRSPRPECEVEAITRPPSRRLAKAVQIMNVMFRPAVLPRSFGPCRACRGGLLTRQRGLVPSAGAKNTRAARFSRISWNRSEEHTSELQSRLHLVCRLLLEKKKNILTTARKLVSRQT